MGANSAVAVSKRGEGRAPRLVCLFTAQILALMLLANCGDGEVAMAMRETLVVPHP